MKNILEQLDAEMRSETSSNIASAQLLCLMADLIDEKSDAQIVAAVVDLHSGDAKAAMQWLIVSRSAIAGVLKMLVLLVALDSKERENTGGVSK